MLTRAPSEYVLEELIKSNHNVEQCKRLLQKKGFRAWQLWGLGMGLALVVLVIFSVSWKSVSWKIAGLCIWLPLLVQELLELRFGSAPEATLPLLAPINSEQHLILLKWMEVPKVAAYFEALTQREWLIADFEQADVWARAEAESLVWPEKVITPKDKEANLRRLLGEWMCVGLCIPGLVALAMKGWATSPSLFWSAIVLAAIAFPTGMWINWCYTKKAPLDPYAQVLVQLSQRVTQGLPAAATSMDRQKQFLTVLREQMEATLRL